MVYVADSLVEAAAVAAGFEDDDAPESNLDLFNGGLDGILRRDFVAGDGGGGVESPSESESYPLALGE